MAVFSQPTIFGVLFTICAFWISQGLEAAPVKKNTAFVTDLDKIVHRTVQTHGNHRYKRSGGRSRPRILWFLDGQGIDNSDESSESVEDSSSPEFGPQDGQWYDERRARRYGGRDYEGRSFDDRRAGRYGGRSREGRRYDERGARRYVDSVRDGQDDRFPAAYDFRYSSSSEDSSRSRNDRWHRIGHRDSGDRSRHYNGGRSRQHSGGRSWDHSGGRSSGRSSGGRSQDYRYPSDYRQNDRYGLRYSIRFGHRYESPGGYRSPNSPRSSEDHLFAF